ncbi:RidA family protein [Amycolatopsis rhabdoformis]|uniref:RidA family protein n=1 Tax=Amycolatopsis rhabdoformis TaxID=1448059 RepID=A0ABZ1IKA2_9PSEU|nr:RidA family protein [Amycolatopsis rhabdoformis]WSE34193.1 RidA family protein [Amycolatopsis rhabdoformis]
MPGPTPEERLRAAGLTLPELRPAAGNYVGAHREGSLVHLAGQGSESRLGRVGDTLTADEGYAAARECMLFLLAQLRRTVGSLDHVRGIAKVVGYVSCTDEFTGVARVLNGASDLLVEVFGDAGRHPRSVVGVRALPMGIAVEVDLIAVVDSDPA